MGILSHSSASTLPATVQGGSLWRDPCIKTTLADNYRHTYNVDYSGQLSPSADQRQVHATYDTSAFSDTQRQHGQEHHQQHQQHHHPNPYQRDVIDSSIPRIQTDSNTDSAASHHQQVLAQPQTSPHGSSQLLFSPAMGPPRGDRMGNPFGAHGSLINPLYPNMSPSNPRHSPPSPHQGSSSGKRPRPEDFDMASAGMQELQHTGLAGMVTTPMGGSYSSGSGMAGTPPLPMTHHHHLPDMGPPSKMMRRDESGQLSAASMVGQEGMPMPAPRPRGPKLKFTAEDDQLLILLKEQKNLTWKQIADFFPGRSSGTLQVRYCTKLKAKTTLWTDDMDQKLRNALQDYENERWRIIAHKVGTGFTPAACRERAAQIGIGDEEYQPPMSPEPGPSESGIIMYPNENRHLPFPEKHHQGMPEQ
ncbi:hypothetical protein MY8738_004259 [Beauveria namnaoensis]